MTSPNEFDLNFENADFSDIAEQLEGVLGDSLRSRTLAAIGHPIRYAAGLPYSIKAQLGEDTDTPGMIWIHQGDYTSDDETNNTDRAGVPALAMNVGAGRLDDKELIFGTPVWVQREGNDLYIMGTGGRRAAEYLHEIPVRPQSSINISQFDYALLKPTSPPSMRVWFSGCIAVLNNVAYRLPAILSDELDSSPPASGQAKSVMIEFDPAAAALVLTDGADFAYDVDLDNPPHEVAFSTDYPVTINAERFLAGWVRVYDGQTIITQKDIIPAQELMSKTNGAVNVSVASVTNPPTDAELDGAFGTPATVGAGFVGVLNNNNADTDVYFVFSTGSSWFYTVGTKAV